VKDRFYLLLTFLTRHLGVWVFLLIAWFIATGYFLFFPKRVAVSVRFYRRLFPDRSRFHPLWCAWRQYHHFVRVFLDRFLLVDGGELATTYEGWDHLVEATESGRGGIVLMSHVGNWEIAAHLLKHYGRNRPRMKLLLYLGEKHREQIERRQKKSVAGSGIRVIAVPEEGGSPLDIVEGLNFLREGGLVSLTGDRVWSREQRTVAVRFAGAHARIPETPFVLALMSGAPILIFFAYRTRGGVYRMITLPPLTVQAAARAERAAAIAAAAQTYADTLEATVRAHPFEWYHFEPFLDDE